MLHGKFGTILVLLKQCLGSDVPVDQLNGLFLHLTQEKVRLENGELAQQSLSSPFRLLEVITVMVKEL